ncbi:MAG: acetyl-CoA carboxylase biotin carboxyl carrier protein subunit [Flavobacteriales bacterium]|jgi:biotin carboxyl carrier protein
MIKALFNDKTALELSKTSDDGLTGEVNGEVYKWDVSEISPNSWSVIDENGNSFSIVLDDYSADSKKNTFKIAGQVIEVTEQSEFDLLLKELGISSGGTKKLKEIKAPMPGLVLNVLVSEGQEVAEGDVIVILEAMKMENVIKSPTGARVKSIRVNKGDTIDKGEVMVTFD